MGDELSQQATRLAAATAAGLIIGMERGWSLRANPDGTRVTGFRTFGLLGLLGALAGMLPDFPAAALVLIAGLTVAAGYRASVTPEFRSATTAVAAQLTIALGFIAVRQSPVLALAGAAVTFALLSGRGAMHGLLKGMAEEERDAVGRFLLVALVVLPLLPDANYGPYGAWNPFRIWLVVVMVTGLSFAGYVASRRWGEGRGLMVVAASGALVSSTAVTVDYARRLKEQPAAAPSLIAGIALASVIMFLRVQAITLALVPMALPTLALALAPATVTSAGFALLAWSRQRAQPSQPVQLGNPLEFKSALLLAGMVAILSVAARWALARFGDNGMATVLVLTGLMDVDAAILTLAGFPAGTVAPALAGLLLAGPVLANTLVKAVMAMMIAPGRAGWRAAAPLLAAFVASAAAMLSWFWYFQRSV